MALQNFIDKVGPVVSAAFLNGVDVIKTTIFGDALTKAQARTALTSDAPLELTNGGTGSRGSADASPWLVFITSLFPVIWQLINPRSAAEIANLIFPSDYSYKVGFPRRYGAVGNGIAVDTTAVLAALNAVGDKGLMKLTPNDNYLVTQQLTICRSGATGPDGIICEDGLATITFSGLGATTDCILVGFGSDTTRQPQFRNLILNAQGTAGRELISVRRDEHGQYINLYLRNSVRDTISFCPQADFDQVENPRLEGVHVERAGRHPFSFIVGAASTVGPFVNEVTGINCEVRGYSWKVAGGAAWYYQVNDNHGGAGIQDHVWIGCNVNVDDGQGTPPFTPKNGLVYLDYNASGSNIMTHLCFLCGGWETSNASTLVKAERNASLGATTNSCQFLYQNLHNIGSVILPGVDWEWSHNNAYNRNGNVVYDPGATGSVIQLFQRVGVTKAQVIWNNEFGQCFYDGENSINFRRYSDSVSFLLVDYSQNRIQAGRKFYPVKDDLTAQTTAGFYAGSGAPNNANGSNGDFYFRGDTPGTVNQRVYVRSAGAWVGIL